MGFSPHVIILDAGACFDKSVHEDLLPYSDVVGVIVKYL